MDEIGIRLLGPPICVCPHLGSAFTNWALADVEKIHTNL
jgi:hypothetical protein